MSRLKHGFVLVAGILGMAMLTTQCVHQPIPPVDGSGNTTDTTGTGNNDTTGTGNNNNTNADPCDPDTVYFTNDILPLLNSSCAVSGCHDNATAEDGVILTSYNSVMQTADVRPGDLGDSDLYEVITETDPDKQMPPPSSGITLSQAQINMIAKWIQQGAKNNGCDPNAGGCDTDSVSYAQQLVPVLNTYCLGCHSGTVISGGVNLDGYNNVVAFANSGQLYGAISHAAGYKPMPQGQPKLDSCTIAQFKSWIDAGAPNN